MVGLIAHVDTTPDVTGAGVSPIVHEAWDGEPITLPGDARQVLDPAELPALAAQSRSRHRDERRHDACSVPTTRPGIAEIMAAVAYLARHRATGRARRSGWRSPSTRRSVAARRTSTSSAFGADVAYTLDGSDLGELEIETFSAASVRVTIRGLSVHPGTAKGKLVNAVKLASELVAIAPAATAVARDD